VTPDHEADRLARLAGELAVRVRDDDPTANARWLLAHTSEADRWALLFVLAAAVPVDVPWMALTQWSREEAPPAAFDGPDVIAGRRAALDRALQGGLGRRRAA
jgi:hypothetical protein